MIVVYATKIFNKEFGKLNVIYETALQNAENLQTDKGSAADDGGVMYDKSGRGKGYDRYSMSVNAREAYSDGEMPISKWSKSEILFAVEGINPDIDISRINLNTLREKFLKRSGWHHTSMLYNVTVFYSIDEEYVKELTQNDVDNIVRTQKSYTKPKRNISYDEMIDEAYMKANVIADAQIMSVGTAIKRLMNKNDFDDLYRKAVDIIRARDAGKIEQWKKLPEGHFRHKQVQLFEEDILSYVGELRQTHKLSRNSKMFKELKRYFEKQAEGLTMENDADILNVSGEQYRVMWTLEEDVLDEGEISAFYNKVAEIRNPGNKNYTLSQNGEYIFEISNKLVYTDGDFYYPEITKVVIFDSLNETILQGAREIIYDGEKARTNMDTTREIIKITCGETFERTISFENSRAYERQIRGRKGKNSRTSDSRSGEDVELYSKSSPDSNTSNSDESPFKILTTEQQKLPSVQLKEEVRKKINAYVEKYGEIEKGAAPVRDVVMPKKTSEKTFVRRNTRTIAEADAITDEKAAALIEEVANDAEWASYYRIFCFNFMFVFYDKCKLTNSFFRNIISILTERIDEQ